LPADLKLRELLWQVRHWEGGGGEGEKKRQREREREKEAQTKDALCDTTLVFS